MEAILQAVLHASDPEAAGHLCEILLELQCLDADNGSQVVGQLLRRWWDFSSSLPGHEVARAGLLRALAVFAGPSMLRRLLAADEQGTFRYAQGVLNAWVFGLRVASASVCSLPAEWADPDDVGLPLSQLAASVQDLGTLRSLVEGLTLLFDYVPRITCAHATALADLLCLLQAGCTPCLHGKRA
jgi:hypothetical protein